MGVIQLLCTELFQEIFLLESKALTLFSPSVSFSPSHSDDGRAEIRPAHPECDGGRGQRRKSAVCRGALGNVQSE